MRFRDLLLILSVVLFLVCPLIYNINTPLMLFCVGMALVSNFAWGCCEAIEQTKKEKNFKKGIDKRVIA